MSICRPISRSICRDVIYPIFGGRIEGIDDAPLLDITLTSGTVNPAERTVIEAMTLRVNYRPILATHLSGLRNWSQQLSLDSVAPKLQYNERSDPVVVDRELVQGDFGFSFNWHGVHQNIADAGIPEDADGNPIYSSVFYSIDNDAAYLYVSALGGIWSGYSNPIASLNLGIEAWLDSRTLAELETFFEGEPYNASTTYIYFDPARPTQMRVFTGATGWTPESFDFIDMVAGTEYDGVTTTELTFDDTDLLGEGFLDITLQSGSIAADINDKFRVNTAFVEGTTTLLVLLPIDLEDATVVAKSMIIGGKQLVVGGKSPLTTGA